MGSPIQVKDSASNIVKWGFIAVVAIAVIMFAFPWLLNLGIVNMNAAWSDQIAAFFNSLSTTATDATDTIGDVLGDMVTPSDEPSPLVDFYSDVQDGIDGAINTVASWVSSWWPF